MDKLTRESATQVCNILQRYELWRHGADCRQYTDLGLTSEIIGEAITAAVRHLALEFDVAETAIPTHDCRICRNIGRGGCRIGIRGECHQQEANDGR